MWRFLFSPNGRVSRADIWLKYLLPTIGLFAVVVWMHFTLIGEDAELIGALLALFYLWPSIAVPVKRLHDHGMTGWWLLYARLIALPGYLAILYGLLLIEREMNLLGYMDGSEDPFLIVGLGYALIVEIVFVVILYGLPGRRGDNEYGTDPLSGVARA